MPSTFGPYLEARGRRRRLHGNMHFLGGDYARFGKRGSYRLVFRGLEETALLLTPAEWVAMQRDLQEVIEVYRACGEERFEAETPAILVKIFGRES